MKGQNELTKSYNAYKGRQVDELEDLDKIHLIESKTNHAKSPHPSNAKI